MSAPAEAGSGWAAIYLDGSWWVESEQRNERVLFGSIGTMLVSDYGGGWNLL